MNQSNPSNWSNPSTKRTGLGGGIITFKWIFLCLIIIITAGVLFITFGLIKKTNSFPVYQRVVQCFQPSPDQVFSVKELFEGIAQNDTRLLKYIRQVHLTPPSTLPYNLSKPNVDPGDAIGQSKVVKRILGNMTHGYFVDAGAHDGEYISNTLGLERDFNWTGLLVEPSPIELPNLRSKNRKAWIANVCLAPSTSPSTLDYLHRENYTIASKLGNAKEIGADGAYWKPYKIPCVPIFTLLSALDVKVVDYFSLDVEGVELKVLKTIPFDLVLIKVISVEYNLIPEGKETLIEFLRSKDYSLVQEVYHDCIFVHNSLNYTKTTSLKTKN